MSDLTKLTAAEFRSQHVLTLEMWEEALRRLERLEKCEAALKRAIREARCACAEECLLVNDMSEEEREMCTCGAVEMADEARAALEGNEETRRAEAIGRLACLASNYSGHRCDVCPVNSGWIVLTST